MAGLVVELRDAHRRLLGHHRAQQFPLSIGRGYDNDLIVADPHVDAHQLRIEPEQQGWLVTDIGSGVNAGTQQSLISGDELVIGKTHLRLLALDHPVEETRPLRDTSVLEIGKSIGLGLALVLALMFSYAFYEYMQISEELLPGKLIADTLPLVAGVMIWAGVWSLFAYIVRHHLYFHYFLAVTVAYVLIDLLLDVAVSFFAFNNSSLWLPDVLSYFTGGLLLVALFYASMHQAFVMSRRRKWVLANLFSWGLVAVIVFAVSANQPEFARNPEYPAELKPPGFRVTAAESFDAFMVEAEKLLNDFND